MKILITDDHPILRRGLKQILNEAFSSVLIDEANDGLEAINKVKTNKYDIVLLDISMPGIDGLETLKEIKKKDPELPCLIISIHTEQQYAIRCIKAGASGYLTKDTIPEELIIAIKRISSGKRYISPSLADILAQDLHDSTPALPHEILSDREYQIMCFIASGKNLKEIADELFLSIKTVSTYHTRILKKMHMSNNAELVRYAIQHQLCI